MKPTTISIQNVKGRDGHYSISPVTMITAGNFAGKTAFLSAIKIALLGYEPKLGKQHRATIQLAAENRPEMSVSMTFDTGSFGRTWKRGKDNEIKYSETGTIPDVPAILMDMAGYFGLKTEQDRVNYVFEKIGSAELNFNDNVLLEKLGTIEALPVKPAEAARADLIKFVAQSIILRNRDKLSIQDFIARLIQDVKDQKKEADQDHKKLGLTMQQFKSNGAAPVSREKDLAGRQEELQKLQSQQQALLDQKKAWDIDQIKIKEIEAALAKPITDTTHLEETLALLLTPGAEPYKSKTADLTKKITTLRERTKQLDTQIEAAKIEHKSALATLQLETCKDPACPWQRAFAQKVIDLEVDLSALTENREKTVKDGKAIKKALETAEADDKVHLAIVTKANELKAQIESSRSLDTGARAVLEQQLADMKSKPAWPAEPLAALWNQISTAQREIEALSGEQNRFSTYQANQVEFKSQEQKLLNHQAKSAVLKLAMEMIGQIQQEILTRAFSVLLEKSRPFTDGLLKFNLEYSPEKAELGYKSPDGWVSHTVFSDSEQALAYAGLSVALAQSSPFKVVFMDEMGKIEAKPVNRKKLVLDRMCQLVEQGVIHAFFGADNRTEDYLEYKNPVFTQVILG